MFPTAGCSIRTRDDVIAPDPVRLGNADDGQVIRLASTAGENDLPWPAAKQRRDALPRLIHRLMSLPPKGVRAGRISKASGQPALE